MAKLGGIVIPLTVTTTGIKTGLSDAQKQFSQFSSTVQADSNKINISTGSIVRGFTAIAGINLGLSGIRDFANEVVRMTGVMQGLNLSFETMLGTKAQADELMMGIKEFALSTPYTVEESAATVKQLIAMGAAGDNVLETFKSLGDVAAGLNVPLKRIAINYGQVAALGKLQQREIRDFAMAGVPIYDALEDVLGRSRTEIVAMVTAGKVGFPAVEKAFRRLSGEGGRFNDMMSKLNSTVIGQLSRLKDKIQLMFADIGESNKGFIYGAINGLSTLVSHYKEIINIVTSLATAYGLVWTAQKLTLSLNISQQNSRYASEIDELEKLIIAKKGVQNQDIQQLLEDKKLTTSQAQRIIALRAEITAEEDAAVKRAVNAKKRIESEIKVTQAVQANIAQRIASIKAAETTDENGGLISYDELWDRAEEIQTLQEQAQSFAKKENKLSTDLLAASERVEAAVSAQSTAVKTANTAATNANANAQTRLAIAGQAAIAMFRRLGAAIIANWQTLAITGIIFAIQAISKSIREANDARKEYEKGLIDEQTETNRLVLELSRANISTEERKKLLEQLKQINPKIVEDIEDEANAYATLSQRIKEYNIVQQLKLAASFIADDENFEGRTERLAKTQARMSEIEAQIRKDYADLLKRIQEEINKNNISESIQKEMDAIIASEMSNIDKLKALMDAFRRSRRDNNPLAGETTELHQAQSTVESYEKILAILQRRLGKVSDSTEILKESIDGLIDSEEGLSDTSRESLRTDLYKFYRIDIEETTDTIDRLGERIKELAPTSESSLSDLMRNADEAAKEIEKLAPNDETLSRWQQLQTDIDNAISSINPDTAEYWNWVKGNASKKLANLEVSDPEFAIQEQIYNTALENEKRFGMNAIRERERQAREAEQAAERRKREKEKEIEDAKKLQEQLDDSLLELELEYRKSVISLMDDGLEKELKKIDEEYRLKEETIRREEENLANLRAGELTFDDQIAFGIQRNANVSNRDNAKQNAINSEKEYYNQLIREYGTYYQKREQLVKDGEKKIADETKRMQSQMNSKSFTEEEKQNIRENYDDVVKGIKDSTQKGLVNLDEQYGRFSKGIEDLFDRTGKKSIDELERIYNRGKKILEALQKGDYEAYRNAEGNTSKMYSEEQFTQYSKDTKFIEDTTEKVEEQGRKVYELKNEFLQLSDAIKRLVGTDKKQALLDISKSLNGISDLVKSTTSDIASMFSAFGDDETAAAVQNVGEVAGSILELGASISQIASGNIVQGIMGAMGAISGIINGIASLFDAANERAIKRLEDQNIRIQRTIDDIDRAIGKLQREQNRSFGSVQSKLIEDENKRLQDISDRNRVLIQNIQKQIAQERDKSKTDDERIKGWEEEINNLNNSIADNNDKIAENKKRMVDAIYGEEIQSAIQDFASAYADAWANGIPSRDGLKNAVKDMMKQAVMQIIMSSSDLESVMKSLRESIIPSILSDGLITDSELKFIEDFANNLADGMDNKFSGLMDIFKNIDEETINQRSSASQTIAQASQDSIDTVLGVIYNIENHTYQTNEIQKAVQIMTNNILTQTIAIRQNTDRLENIENYIRNTMISSSDSLGELRKFNR